jgi:hypothetical protein
MSPQKLPGLAVFTTAMEALWGFTLVEYTQAGKPTELTAHPSGSPGSPTLQGQHPASPFPASPTPLLLSPLEQFTSLAISWSDTTACYRTLQFNNEVITVTKSHFVSCVLSLVF